jgi:hypothetical protein
MTDSRARKIILLEDPMLPVHYKAIITNFALELLRVHYALSCARTAARCCIACSPNCIPCQFKVNLTI